MENKLKIFLFCIAFVLVSTISAAAISDQLHVNIQVTDSNGKPQSGYYNFAFNITTDEACSNVVYSNLTSLSTDSRGIISYYLQNVNLNFTDQYWLCYYRNGTLINNSKMGRVPYAFMAKNITSPGIIWNSNTNVGAYNISASWILANLNWSYIQNAPSFLTGEPNWNANYSTFLTHIDWSKVVNGTMASWSQAMNGTLAQQSTVNTNITNANTSMKNYVDLLNSSGLIKNWNASSLIINWSLQPAGTEVFWNANYSTFLTHIDWSKVVNGTMASWSQAMNGTLAQQSTVNTNITNANTSMKNYVDLLNSSGLIKNWNASSLIINWSLQPAGIETLWNANYSTFLTHIDWSKVVNGTMASWSQAMNGTLAQQSTVNTNITNANTSMKNYVDLLNSSGLIKNWNASSLIINWSLQPAGIETFWNANYSTYLLKPVWADVMNSTLWGLVMNGTVAQQSTVNTNITNANTSMKNYVDLLNSSGLIKNWNASSLIINWSLQPAGIETLWNANYSTYLLKPVWADVMNSTLWSLVMNGTLAQQSTVNTNITNANTSMKNYVDLLNSSGLIKNWNASSLIINWSLQPAGTEVFWNANYSTYLLKPVWADVMNSTLWGLVMNGTVAQQSTVNTNITNANTSMKNYVDLLNSSGLIKNWNASSLIINWSLQPAGTETFWNANYSTYLTHRPWSDSLNGTLATWAQAMNNTLAQQSTVNTNITNANTSLSNYVEAYYLRNDGDNGTGNYNFNNGWTQGGVTISGGSLYAQTIYVYNISSLRVNNIEMNGSIYPQVDNTFSLGNGTYRWKSGNFSDNISASWILANLNWSYVQNAPSFLTGETLWNANYSTFLTHIDWSKVVNGTMASWSQAMNGTLAQQSTVNTNITNANTSMKNYVDLLNSSGLIKNWNASSLIINWSLQPAGTEVFWNANYSTFLTHIDWSKVVNGTMASWSQAMNGTLAQQSTVNTNITNANTSMKNYVDLLNSSGLIKNWNASSLIINWSLQPAGTEVFWNANYSTYLLKPVWADVMNSTLWGLVMNGTVAQQSTVNTNITNANTSMKNYVDLLNSSGLIKNWNASNLIINWSLQPAGIETLWNANYSTFLTHPTWANVMNGTVTSGFYNAANAPIYLNDTFRQNYSVYLTKPTWANVMNGTVVANWNNNYSNFTTGWLYATNSTGTGTVIGYANIALTNQSNTFAATYNQTFDTSTLFIDAVSDRVGIGTTAPDSRLHVVGNANITGNLSIGVGIISYNATSGSYVYYNGTGWYAFGTGSGTGTADGTGGWTNTSTITSTNLNVNISATASNPYLYFGKGGYIYDNGTATIIGHA